MVLKDVFTSYMFGLLGGFSSLGLYCLYKHFLTRSGIKRLRTQDPRSSGVVIHNGIVYTAGQVGEIPKLEESDITEQTKQTLAKIEDLLAEVETGKSRLLEARIWLKDISRDAPAMNKNVELRKSDKAWMPGVAAKKKEADPEGDDLEELKKKVRAILNNETLVKQFQELPIDTKEKMESAMELVFEKAVDEPAFSVAYAQMCHNLAQREISVGEEKVKFRTILIRRVQKEFDKDYMKDVDMELKKKSEDASLSEAERKMAREEFETQERKARKRSLGNIRFIGELYNLQLLTLNIMHDCVNKLISKTDEESLECLCKLITTVGSQFDKETNVVLTNRKDGNISKINMEKKYPAVKPIQFYFDRMHEIIEKRATTSRVRFLMQDVIDLKKASWKKRREEAGPKKIDQIHEDMKKEELFSLGIIRTQCLCPSNVTVWDHRVGTQGNGHKGRTSGGYDQGGYEGLERVG